MIWNSCTPSCDKVERIPLTELSTASMPSTFTALERARWPPKFSPDVGAEHRRGPHVRTELWRPARAFQRRERGWHGCSGQFSQRNSFYLVARGRAGIPDHYQRL